jgi:hypothetical protein
LRVLIKKLLFLETSWGTEKAADKNFDTETEKAFRTQNSILAFIQKSREAIIDNKKVSNK